MKQCLCILSFFLPIVSHAQVLINEVAWMGTSVNANDEWIELYNDGTSPVSLDGWVLTDNVSFSINLSGTLGSGEYGLLERTDDTTVVGKTALLIYTGALANDGRTLTLKRSDTTTEDEVVGGSNWENIGGDNITKATPQRTQSGWTTGTGTPGIQNISNGEMSGINDSDGTEVQESSSGSSNIKRSSSGTVVKKKVLEPEEKPELTLEVLAPKIAYVHERVDFEVVPDGLGKTIMNSLGYTWNFGDTYTDTGKKTSHVFEYPGEYVVVVESVFAKQKAQVRHDITILPITFSLERTADGDIVLSNKSKHEIDLGGFTLEGVSSFVFPKLSLIKAGGKITISKKRIGENSGRVSLWDTERTLVASSEGVRKDIAPQVVTSFVARVQEPVTAEVKEDVESVIQGEGAIIKIGEMNEQEIPKKSGFFSIIKRFFGL
jgi:hypothetical protein